MEKAIGEHVSDCSVYYEGECDCGGLKLADYAAEDFVPTLVSSTGRFGFFVDHLGRECFIGPEVLPSGTLAAIASASNLPDVQEALSVLRGSNGMNLDDARETVISKFKALSLSQRAACDIVNHEPLQFTHERMT